MNKISGIIANIQHSGAILLVDIDVAGHSFSALLVESATSMDWLQKGNPVTLVFKETEVSLAKNLSGKISLRNRMLCKVKRIDRGELLSNVLLHFHEHSITSAITTRAVNLLQLEVGDEIEALIKSNEVSLMR
ncbi:MAG: TOBE domain-containing protein [Prolixibacteraceae bacterium]|nr:TOBE domain-containing protein [Prolixibacteraceae bacterium]